MNTHNTKLTQRRPRNVQLQLVNAPAEKGDGQVQLALQHVQLQLKIAQHYIAAPQRQVQVRRVDVVDVLVDVRHQQRRNVRLEHGCECVVVMM